MSVLVDKIAENLQWQQMLIEEQQQLTWKAMQSNDPVTLMKANKLFTDISVRQDTEQKSRLVDPFEFSNALQYKTPKKSASYDMLRRMGSTPILHAIISTRVDQVASFCEPQKSQHDIGFVIRKKKEDDKRTKRDEYIIEDLTEFILNCGLDANKWHGDSFEDFLRKLVKDSLELDQATFEVIRDRKGSPVEFLTTDASTFRISDTIDDHEDTTRFRRGQYEQSERKFGYTHSFVQVIDEQIMAEFFPWELCFGIRNPTSNLRSNGYGVSELEILTKHVTWMLFGDQYNGSFFSQGAAPKGILKVAENVSENRLAEFRQQWMGMITGVQNAHRTPVIRANEMEWINLQMNNTDMQFGKWQEYLIQVACATYKIAPDEIGFKIQGGGDQKPLFESNNEGTLKYSKDKGLRPLLRFISAKINRYLIKALNSEYEFAFVGLDSETEAAQVELDIKKGQSFMTVKELRRKYNLPDKIDPDDVISNGIWLQNKNAMAQQQQDQGGDQGYDDQQDQSTDDSLDDENPLYKSFLTNIKAGMYL